MKLNRPFHLVNGLPGLLLLVWLMAGAAIVCGCPKVASGQVITGSISGTVTDTTGALIPNASVKLVNQTTGGTRTVRANSSGSFSFVGVSSGDYTVSVTNAGFEQFTEKGIHLDPGDSRKLPAVVLKAGSESTTVTVEAESNIPLDTGERSDLITAEDIKHLSIEGRDVTELFKILPGFAIANQGINNASFDSSQVNVNGALGNFAANGNPLNGISLKLDGADITDPGNYGAAIQNVNYDQVSEVKVQVSNFGADIANGPVVVTAVTKSGSNTFHGQLYTYARTSQLDSLDALSRATGEPKDPDREVYPGIAISGPVLIPGTSFNHNRKLTFFAGAEDYAQRNIYAYGSASGALVHALVPTANMRNGTFTASELSSYLGDLYTQPAYSNIAAPPTIAIDGTTLPTPGMIPSQYADAGTAAIFATFPLPNQHATVANPYNWQAQDFINNNMWQAIGRVDLDISNRNHLFGRYSVERGASGVPQVPYYNPGELNTPGGGLNTNNSQSAAANLTTQFSPSLTNQLFGALGFLDSSYVSANVSVLTNYPYQGAYKNGRHPLPELENYDDQSGLPRQLTPDYSLGPIFARKFQPDGGDTITKLWRAHTISAGVYVARITNNQRTPFVPTNGYLDNYYMPGAGSSFVDLDNVTKYYSGNWVANYYEGIYGGYGQTSSLPQVNLYFWDTDFFANDSWRIRPHLTVNFGARFQHLGQWTDAHGIGLAVFRPDLINSSTPSSPYPGFLWHAIDSSVPLSGVSSKPMFVDPRVGFAWDVRGNGTTVLRGGWGEYREHDSWNDATNAASITQNSQSVSYGAATLKAIGSPSVNPPAATLSNSLAYPSNVDVTNLNSYGGAGALAALNATDNEEPLTDTYSLTLNQQLPWKMNMLVGYVGNNSRYLLNNGSNQTVALDNINAIPIGGLYRPNPYSGQVLVPVGTNTTTSAGAYIGYASVVSSAGTAQVNEYRPLNTALVQYGAIDVPQHVLFANYNGLQAGLTRQSGKVLFGVNYTFSRAMGIRGAFNNGEPGNPFNIWDNYGPENFDRRHIFNATYTYMVGKALRNRFAGAMVNGWEVSGIINYQSGPNIVVTTSNPGFGVNGTIGASGSANAIAITNTVYLGTPDVSLQPVLTCDPHSGLSGRQYINGNCFTTPNLLDNGPYQYPDLRGPGYFNADMSLQRSIHVHGDQNVFLRFSAFNFLNHALPSFNGSFPNETTLTLSNPNGTTFTQGSGADAAALGFGSAPYEEGRRVVEMSLKYTF
jgi:hypothetical protein